MEVSGPAADRWNLQGLGGVFRKEEVFSLSNLPILPNKHILALSQHLSRMKQLASLPAPLAGGAEHIADSEVSFPRKRQSRKKQRPKVPGGPLARE